MSRKKSLRPFLVALTLLIAAPCATLAEESAAPKQGEAGAREEKLQAALKRYPEADLDHDGKLSPQEARAAFQKMRGGAAATTQPASSTSTPAAAQRTRGTGTAKSALPKPDFADVSYGDHPNDKFDLWLAKSDKPTPLLVYIHGGGFRSGDKSGASPQILQACLDAGVSFATINYRFRTEASINVVLRDPARAIQFFRHKASEYNLDKTRIATYGGSAGAGTSLWLAFHDDLADPKSSDPVSRESTRIVGAAASACQATYDILKWEKVLGSAEAMRFQPQSEWPAFYGLKTLDDLQTEEGKKLRADVDMLGLISKDDPPIWLGTRESHEGFATKGDVLHNPKHADAVKKQCDEIGVKCEIKRARVGKPAETGASMIQFLIQTVKGGG